MTLEIFDGFRDLEGHFLSIQIDGEHEAAEVDRLSGVVEELRGESGHTPGKQPPMQAEYLEEC